MNSPLLPAPDSKYDLTRVCPLPRPPKQRLHLNLVWPTFLAAAELSSNNWRKCVPEPTKAAALLEAKERRSADAMANERCTQRSGKDTKMSRLECDHEGVEQTLCTVMWTLRSIG